jgi:hypothetical protein
VAAHTGEAARRRPPSGEQLEGRQRGKARQQVSVAQKSVSEHESSKESSKRTEWNSLLGLHGGALGWNRRRAPFGTSIEEKWRETKVRKPLIVQPLYDRYKPVVGFWRGAWNRRNDKNGTHFLVGTVEALVGTNEELLLGRVSKRNDEKQR